MRESRLRWFGHVYRTPMDVPVRRIETMELTTQINRDRGRPKKTWKETIKNDLKYLQLNKEMCNDRTRWRQMIHTADPT